MSFQPPKGTDDLLAPDSQRWRAALRLWEDFAERFGYSLVMTPVLEATELFERGVGNTTEVVTKQMYTFTDRGGRSVTLRPEGTAGVVRAYLNSGGQGAWKGAYSGPFFRYERPQGGRRRQFWQVGAEYLDVESPQADSEIIELGYRYLSAVGVPELELVINSLGAPESRSRYVSDLRTYLHGLGSQLSSTSRDLIERNPLRVLDSKEDRGVLVDPPRMVEYLSEADADHYDEVKKTLQSLDVPYNEDDRLVRGLDYYSRTTFEYVGRGLETAQNAVGGGGRYDGLAEMIGGPRTPGVGFALGVDRIIISVGETDTTHLDAYLVSETGPAEAIAAASRLREQGIRVDFDTEGRSVKAQFRTAKRLDTPVILVWRGAGQPVDVQSTGDRTELEFEDIPDWFRRQT